MNYYILHQVSKSSIEKNLQSLLLLDDNDDDDDNDEK
jgi:hypothetical protein